MGLRPPRKIGNLVSPVLHRRLPLNSGDATRWLKPPQDLP
jgi:hypothetical protein